MSSLHDAVELTTEILKHNAAQTIMWWGAPGSGKTSGTREVGRNLGCDVSSDSTENFYVFRPSLHDSVDASGLPRVVGDYSEFTKSGLFKRFDEDIIGDGIGLLVIDEFPQANMGMKNVLGGAALDRYLSSMKFGKNVRIISTGNRAKDKAGTTAMPTQVNNRMLHLDIDTDINGWSEWALDSNVPIWLISFLRFKPDLLNAFNPDSRENPTERTWEMVGRLPDTLSDRMLGMAMEGLVGKGAAAEALGFKSIADALPNIDVLLMNPNSADVPTDPAVKYAITGALASRATKDNFESVCIFADRMPPEFTTLVMRDSVHMKPQLQMTKPFIKWAAANSGVLI